MPYSNIMMSNISAIHEIILILFMAGRISKMGVWGRTISEKIKKEIKYDEDNKLIIVLP
jgi:hypothetical protein